MKRRLARQVFSVRISAEVVVKGDVLLEEHDEVLDRRGCAVTPAW
jgi:hypothetical protein